MFSILFLNFWTWYEKTVKRTKTSQQLRQRTCRAERRRRAAQTRVTHPVHVFRTANLFYDHIPLPHKLLADSIQWNMLNTLLLLVHCLSVVYQSRKFHTNVHTSTWPYLQPTILIRSHAHMTHAWNPPILRYYLYPSLWSTLCCTQLMILSKSFWGPYRAGTRVSQRITLKLCITLLDVQGNGFQVWKRALSCLISTQTTAHFPFTMPSQPPYCVHYISAPFQHPNNVKTDLESSIKARSDHVFRYPVTHLLTEISTLETHTEKHEILKISTHFPISCDNHIT